MVVGDEVDLFATNYTIGDTDQTYLYGITDMLAFTQASQATGESFAELAMAPGDTTFKGVAFAPVDSETPLPAALPLFATGLGGLGLLGWRRKKKAAAEKPASILLP